MAEKKYCRYSWLELVVATAVLIVVLSFKIFVGSNQGMTQMIDDSLNKVKKLIQVR